MHDNQFWRRTSTHKAVPHPRRAYSCLCGFVCLRQSLGWEWITAFPAKLFSHHKLLLRVLVLSFINLHQLFKKSRKNVLNLFGIRSLLISKCVFFSFFYVFKTLWYCFRPISNIKVTLHHYIIETHLRCVCIYYICMFHVQLCVV